jgi:YhcH/YjgK/YiaL family protein
MIYDSLQHSHLYSKLSTGIASAFQFVLSNDATQLSDGRHDIDGDNVFALVFGYDTKDENECITEAHYAHIDLHYIISGEEMIGQANLNGQVPLESNLEKDYAFYKTDLNYLKLVPGKFAIFFPHDIHLTGKKVNEVSSLRKMVVKIKV